MTPTSEKIGEDDVRPLREGATAIQERIIGFRRNAGHLWEAAHG